MKAARNIPRAVLLWFALALLASAGTAQAQGPVVLGSSGSFAVLAGAAVNSTGSTLVTGDLGVGPGSSISGFPPGIVNGTVHTGDSAAAQAQLDAAGAYGDAAGRIVTATLPTQLGGATLSPGAYESDSGKFDVGGTLTLDAQRNGNAVFIFKTATTLDVPAFSQINLIRSAQACNVLWQVGGSATLGAGAAFRGSVLAVGDITAGSGTTVDGRLLSRSGSVALSAGTVTIPQCDRSRPSIEIRNVPRGCASSFKARFRVSDGLGFTTSVRLDRRRIKLSSKGNFIAGIGANKLGAGRHTLRAVATDDAGNASVALSRFRRC